MFSDVDLLTGTGSSPNHNIDAYGDSLSAQQQAPAWSDRSNFYIGVDWTKDEMEKIKLIEEDEDIITLKVQEEVKLNNDLFI